MAHELKLPDLGEGIVAPLVEIQTDTATVAVPSRVGGTVLVLLQAATFCLAVIGRLQDEAAPAVQSG